jgi:hypothetical protein
MTSMTSELANTAELTYENVLKMNNKIRMTDKNEETGLELFCYNHCDNNESDFVKKCRGVVFHDGKLVMSAYPYTDEYSHTELNVLEKVLTNFSKWTFFEAYEGTLLRMFYFSGTWFLTTHRKLNAFRSKWSSKDSFGTLFKRALSTCFKDVPNESILETFQNGLDKNRQYMFLVRNTHENRIVSDPPKNGEPLVYHVGTFIDGKLDLFDQVGLPKPKKLNFLNIDELVDYVSKINYKEAQGVMCFGPNSTPGVVQGTPGVVQCKVYNSLYHELSRVRGNIPSVKFRYLQVRMTKDLVNKLYSLYPDMIETFEDYEKTLGKIAEYIYNAYTQRFISRYVVTVPVEEYQVVKDCHKWFLLNPRKHYISIQKVISELNKQPPTNLNRMIRRHKAQTNSNLCPRFICSANNSPAVLPMENTRSPPFTSLLTPSNNV